MGFINKQCHIVFDPPEDDQKDLNNLKVRNLSKEDYDAFMSAINQKKVKITWKGVCISVSKVLRYAKSSSRMMIQKTEGYLFTFLLIEITWQECYTPT